MNEPPPSDPDDFQKELEILRSILQQKLQQTKLDPLTGTHLEFWLESARFLELNIELWDHVGNAYEENRARERMRKVLDILQQMIDLMNSGMEDGEA